MCPCVLPNVPVYYHGAELGSGISIVALYTTNTSGAEKVGDTRALQLLGLHFIVHSPQNHNIICFKFQH